MKYLGLLLLLLVALTVSGGQKNRYLKKKKVLAAGTQTCTSDNFASIDKCCAWPKLLPYESFKVCVEELRNIAKKSAKLQQEKGGKSASYKSAGFFSNLFKPFNTRSSGSKSSRASLPGGPTCMTDCMLRQQNLTSSSALDVAAIVKSFSATGDSTWQPIIKEAVTSCDAEIKKLDPKGLVPIRAGPDSSKECRQEPGLLLTCVRRYLALACPDNYKSKKLTRFCEKQLSDLKSCNPFSIQTTTTATPTTV